LVRGFGHALFCLAKTDLKCRRAQNAERKGYEKVNEGRIANVSGFACERADAYCVR